MPAPAATPLDLSDPGVRRAWEALREVSPVSSPFGSLAFADAVEVGFGLRPKGAGVHRDGALVAAHVAFEKRRGPVRLGVVPPLTPVTPVLLADVPSEAEVHSRTTPLDGLIAGLADGFDAVSLRIQPAFKDVRPWTWAGFSARPIYTYAQDLGDGMLAASGRGVRQRVRRDGDGFTFHEAPDALAVLAVLEREVYARQNTSPPLDPASRDTFLRSLMGSGLVRLFVLREIESGRAVAAQAVVSDGVRASVICGAGQPGSAMTLITHHLREQLYSDGVQRIDLVGANIAPIAEFKRGFGMPLTMQFVVSHVARRSLRALSLVRPVV